jgi:hypothetical protein
VCARRTAASTAGLKSSVNHSPAFIDRNGLDLNGKYIGQTSATVKEAITAALGGCLFTDEACALNDSGDTFSVESIRAILTGIENNRNNLLVVLAGYRGILRGILRGTAMSLDDIHANRSKPAPSFCAAIPPTRLFARGYCENVSTCCHHAARSECGNSAGDAARSTHRCGSW